MNWLITGIIACLLLIFGAYLCVEYESGKHIETHGFNLKDVDVFLISIGRDRYEFVDSPGLQAQYKLFASGQSSEFIKSAMDQKSKKQIQNAILLTGSMIAASR